MVTLDPEPFACYGAVILDEGTSLEDFTWERRILWRHSYCHEGDVHFEPRLEYEQDSNRYPESIWEEQ